MAVTLSTLPPPLTLTPGIRSVGSEGSGAPSTDPTDSTSRYNAAQSNISTSQSPIDIVQLSREAEEIRRLQMRDREVRAHEAAHAAVGGSIAGSPSFSYARGPDGHNYAVGGKVSIDVSPVSGDPEATLQKAEQIRAAALAPAQPSSQDLRIAQRAQLMAAEAKTQLASEQSQALSDIVAADNDDPSAKNDDIGSFTETNPVPPFVTDSAMIPRLTIYA